MHSLNTIKLWYLSTAGLETKKKQIKKKAKIKIKRKTQRNTQKQKSLKKWCARTF